MQSTREVGETRLGKDYMETQGSWPGTGIVTQCLSSPGDFRSRLGVERLRKSRRSGDNSSGVGISQPAENTGRVLDWNRSRTLRLTAPMGVLSDCGWEDFTA